MTWWEIIDGRPDLWIEAFCGKCGSKKFVAEDAWRHKRVPVCDMPSCRREDEFVMPS